LLKRPSPGGFAADLSRKAGEVEFVGAQS
jgi:hypothetical protein